MYWKVRLKCVECGSVFYHSSDERRMVDTCHCGRELEPVFYQYDFPAALAGGIDYIRRELNRERVCLKSI